MDTGVRRYDVFKRAWFALLPVRRPLHQYRQFKLTLPFRGAASVNLVDAMISWDSQQWRVALNVNNLADKTYVSTCLGRGDCWYGARRNTVLSASYKW